MNTADIDRQAYPNQQAAQQQVEPGTKELQQYPSADQCHVNVTNPSAKQCLVEVHHEVCGPPYSALVPKFCGVDILGGPNCNHEEYIDGVFW